MALPVLLVFLLGLLDGAAAARIQPGSLVHRRANNASGRMSMDPRQRASNRLEARHRASLLLHSTAAGLEARAKLAVDPVPSTPSAQANSTGMRQQLFSLIETESKKAIAQGTDMLHSLVTYIEAESQKTPRLAGKKRVVVGIGIFLLVGICFGWMIVDRCLSSSKGNGEDLENVDESPCPRGSAFRRQHMHKGHLIYEWDQTSEWANIYIQPPDGLSKQDFSIKMSSHRLQVGRKGKPPFLVDDFYDTICEEASSWTFQSNGELQLHFRKKRKSDWPYVLQHKREGSSAQSEPGSQIGSFVGMSFSS